MNNGNGMDRSVMAQKKKSQHKDTWRRFKKSKTAMLGLCILCVIIFCTLFANLIVPYSKALEQVAAERNLPPSAEHWFGTDLFGRDIFARVVHGTRYSFLMGAAAVCVGIGLGSIFGAIAGFFGGWIDSIIMRVMDVLVSIPMMLLALSIVAALGTGLVNVLIAIVVSNIPYYTRLIRSSILNVAGMDYIEAAKACGTPDRYIILKHILPNAIGPVIVQATMSVGNIIISAASLSFLGMGIQPPTPEWGAMLSEGKNFMLFLPHMVIFPGLAIVMTAFSLNLMGDGLRDALDPRLKD